MSEAPDTTLDNTVAEQSQQDLTASHRVAAAALESFVGAVLRGAGADAPSADAAVRALVGASLRGVDSHGVRLLPHYVKVLEGGRVKGRPQMRFDKRAAAVGVLDADNALGHFAGYRAMEEAVRLAEDAGVGAVSVLNSSHFGAAGAYSLAAAEAGCLGLCVCNSDSAVFAHSGQAKFHGTNPISLAAPVAGQRPYLLDMATSSIPFNRVLQFRALGQRLPAEVAVDAEGKVTQDSEAATALLPLGGSTYGYKGAGLAGLVEILSAALTGMRLSHEIPSMIESDWSKPRDMGQFFLALKPEVFLPSADYQERMAAYLDALRNQPSLEGESVMAAGDREWAVEDERSARGIPLDAHNWQVFAGLAERFSLEPLAVL
ncbi:Ldh family oxidoreductase [Pelagibius sp.]|uniref:Ldh family oxidoreductase n=1 Tax=Pelagibius sp. TaxID=1931238 RepID=UPI00261C6C46|nr:Ldh family oxidoreductase [Pelagibius sp.]